MTMITRQARDEPLAEAALHVEAARRLAAAQITEEGWAADPFVVAAVVEHLERAARWLDVASWPLAPAA